MKIAKTVLISVISLALFLGSGLFIVGLLKPKPGGILIDANTISSVYINGSFVGQTPFTGTYDNLEMIVKIVPAGENLGLPIYETKLSLTSGVQTVVRREFGKTEDESSGDIISFEKENGKTGLVVISTPDNAQISVDGIPRGFTPYKTSSMAPAQHQITVKAPGYSDRIMTVKTLNGYRLTVFAKLGKINDDVPLTPPSKETSIKTYIEILDTPTGFLRVRSEPGVLGREIAEVKPGSKYLFLSQDTASGWYEIEYQGPQAGLPDGISGWVSDQFTKKLEESQSTPSASQVIVPKILDN